MSEHQDLIADFITEALEILDGYDEDLVHLERENSDSERIHSVFRRVHNIKGMCGFLHFTILERLTHAGEDLLNQLRDDSSLLTSESVDVLLRLGDSMRAILLNVQQNGDEGDDAYNSLLEQLLSARKNFGIRKNSLSGESSIPPESAQASASAHIPPNTGPSEHSLRVEISLLDKLMNLAGELVLARNQILQLCKAHPDPVFRSVVQKLNTVTSELQEGVMKTRVQAISSLWDKLPRIVRDAAHETHKQIILATSGGETELDKAILEAIKDPIIHLIRNAIDHGIELPDVRRQQGKPVEGHISLRAFPDGGQVIVELRDDGRGLDTEKIRQRALERGLVTVKQADSMSDSQIHRLIFTPGFSTADSVTKLSGRGVGMDVVRANIEAIGGQAQIVSEHERGTIVRLKIPMTLSIIPTLLVSCDRDTFAIPEQSVLELVRITSDNTLTSVISIGSSRFLSLREQLLPLVCLRDYLGLASSKHSTEDCIAIILSVEGCRFGVMVDEVHDIEEIVVKPLDSRLQALNLYGGATILGDGRIVLIVDPAGMLDLLQLTRPDDVETCISDQPRLSSPTEIEQQSFLIASTDLSPHTAIALSYVQRLERPPIDSFTTVGGVTTLQYRGSVLAVVDLSRNIPSQENSKSSTVVVIKDETGREIGLRVHDIVDIATCELPPHTTTISAHSMRLGIIDNNTSVLLDVPRLCDSMLGVATSWQMPLAGGERPQ